MLNAHDAQARLTRWQSTLPREVAVPDRKRPVTRDALLTVIREELLPFVTFGPTYRRPVADNLGRALDMYCRDRGEEFLYWLTQALNSAISVRDVEAWEPDIRTVTATRWGVSCVSGTGIDGHVLHVTFLDDDALNSFGGRGVTVPHPVYDGVKFSSLAAARLFAFGAGLTKRFVPESAVAAG